MQIQPETHKHKTLAHHFRCLWSVYAWRSDSHIDIPVHRHPLRKHPATIVVAVLVLREDTILKIFAEAEKIKFPVEELTELMPEVMEWCKNVADSLSVPVSWVLVAEICTLQRYDKKIRKLGYPRDFLEENWIFLGLFLKISGF